MIPPTHQSRSSILSGEVCPPRWYNEVLRRITGALVDLLRERRRRRHGEHIFTNIATEQLPGDPARLRTAGLTADGVPSGQGMHR